MMNRKLLLLFPVLILAACSRPVAEPIDVSYTPVDKPELILPEVDSITALDVDWIVITEDNFEEVVAEMRSRGDSISFFAVTADGYESLSINVANIKKLVEQQKAVIAAYERYNNE